MRVLRQLSTFSEAFEKVIVCARPIPDSTVYYHADNVKWIWFENEEILRGDQMRRICELSKKYGIYEEIVSIFPTVLDEYYADSENGIEYEMEIQKILMSHSRWDEVREGAPGETPDEIQHDWALYNLDLFFQWADLVANENADIVYCNDFDTLLCGVVHKKVHGSRFVYDEHDLYCDSFPYLFPLIYRYFIAQFEFKFIKYADAVISVSESATEWIAKTYDLIDTPLFVPNCKDVKEESLVRGDEIDYPIRLYFQGFVDAGKGLGEVIEAIKDSDEAVLHLRCFENDYLTGLKEFVKINKLEEKVKFLEPVSPLDVISATYTDGDIGLTIMGGETSIGLRNTITNKLIEYLTAGLPVIVSAGMFDQAGIVKKYDAGFVIGAGIGDELPGILDEIRENPGILKTKSINAGRAADKLFRWEIYQDSFLKTVKGEAKGKILLTPEKQKRITYEDLKTERDILGKLNLLVLENRSEIVQEKRNLEKELAKREKDIEDLKGEIKGLKENHEIIIREMKESNSWRIGRALTKPGRLLKKVIKHEE